MTPLTVHSADQDSFLPDDPIIVATRKSPLALAQTQQAMARFEAVLGVATEELRLATTGDKQSQWSLEKQGGKGLFTKELEDALLDGGADVAIHSAKDMPTEIDERLEIVGYLPREVVHDVLIVRNGTNDPVMFASSSPRRRAQVKLLYPRAVWKEIRGNVDTRLRKIADGHADATILAAAGLRRLGIEGWEGVEFRALSIREVVPAVGQGAIAIQCRAGEGDQFRKALHEPTRIAVETERAFLRRLGGGCQTPFAAHRFGNTFAIFHENCGLREYDLTGIADEDLGAYLDKLVAEISD